MKFKNFAILFQMMEFVFKNGMKKMILHLNSMFLSPLVGLCLQKTLWRAWWNQIFFFLIIHFLLMTLKNFAIFFKQLNLFLKIGQKNDPALKSSVYKFFGEPLFTKDTLTCMMKSAFFSFLFLFLLMKLKNFAILFHMMEFVFRNGTKKNFLHSNPMFISPLVSLYLQ